MKEQSHSSLASRKFRPEYPVGSRASGKNGVALVIVLAALVLISVLVISFFSSVTTELSSAKQYASGESTRQLADSAVQLVMAQVANATAGFQVTNGSGSPDTTKPLAWASQPGMIRTYDNSGAPYQFYKLYSSDQMVLQGSTLLDPVYMNNEIANWYSQPAMFTDINQPVLVPDPAGSITTGSGGAKSTFNAHYPILDPMAQASAVDPTTGIEGFSVSGAAAGYAGMNPPNSSYNPSTSAIANPAPMPVKWLYVLRDGTVVAPALAAGNAVTVPGATSANPISGRVAFWTDDETCKVNINTASEGIPWDPPRANTTQERTYASSQPYQKEYQRYSGHPATTALSPIFFPGQDLTDSTYSGNISNREKLYNLIAPRVTGGGSKGGTVPVSVSNVANGWDSSLVLKSDADRLYTSVDELLFKPDRTQNSTSLITPTVLQRARFFLTANSRAPEVNLFNQPRLSMWPIFNTASQDSNWSDGLSADKRYLARTTSFDRTIAFCTTTSGTVHPKRYFFQREKSDDSTYDYASIPRNQDLYKYLQRLTGSPIPGFGGDFLTKYGNGRDQILTEIFDYIRMTNMFDDTLTISNDSTDSRNQTIWPWNSNENDSALAPLPQYTKPRFVENQGFATYINYWPGHGQVTPIQIDTGTATRGFGRFYSIAEAGLDFICNIDPKVMRDDSDDLTHDVVANKIKLHDPVTNIDETGYAKTSYWYNPGDFGDLNNDGVTNASDVLVSGTHRVIQVAFFMKPFCAAMGDDGIRPSMHVHITGLDQLHIINAAGVEQSLGLPAFGEISTSGTSTSVTTKVGQTWAMKGGHRTLSRGGVEAPRMFCSWVTDPFYGVRVAVKIPADKTFKFIGNDVPGATPIKIELIQGMAGTGQANQTSPPAGLVQTINITFSSGNFPIPELVAGGTSGKYKYDMDGNYTADSNDTTPMSRRQYWNWFKMTTAAATFAQNSRLDARDSGDTVALVGGEPGLATLPPDQQVPTDSTASQAGNQDSGALFRVDVFDYDGTALGSPRKRDVVRSVVPAYNDARLICARTNVQPSDFVKHPDYDNVGEFFAHSFLEGDANVYGGNWKGTLYPGLKTTDLDMHRLPDSPLAASSLPANALDRGDWDNGPGWTRDGAYINKSDDGNIGFNQDYTSTSIPYYSFRRDHSGTKNVVPGPTYFSPNRKIPSPVMFGSLPTGINANIPFQTLLFRPDSTFNTAYKHPGGRSPKDHLLLDLFTMPVVEPYAISEPFSTAGKINMNYRIMPFSYITRSTGIQAVLKNEMVTAIPNSAKANYKWTTGGKATVPSSTANFRYKINLDPSTGTLKGFEDRFASNDIFRSASEICDIHLVPQIGGVTYSGMDTFWPNYVLTGDNTRERPYANIYPRLTTKSNSYTVHVRVQSLRKVPGYDPTQWVEGRDQITGEYRGASIIERYIDANDSNLPDFATDATANIDKYYRFHVVSTKRFSP